MHELLSLSRAARLADVSRAELQRRIRQGHIETFEGQVAISDLLRLYPTVRLDRDKGFERVESIKAAAVPRDQQSDAVLPDPQVLMSRLRSLAEVLVQKVTALDAAEELLDAVAERLAAMADCADPGALRSAASEARSWLAAERQVRADHPKPDTRAQLFAKDTFLRIMAANIKIIPSGHEFFVEGTETILDASVRAGLKLAYGCASGNCGTCKARVVSGEVWKTADHDYVLSEREKQMGYILTCSNTAVTDLVLEASEALSTADLPLQEIRASVRKTELLSDDLLLVQVQTPRTHTLRFMAGQRARLTLENGASGEVHIASCPCNGRNLQFYLRRSSGDALAEAAFTQLAVHQMITVTGPMGDLVLHEGAPDPAVFVAVHDGIAPIKSILEHAVSIDLIEAFHLYWADRGADEHRLGNWCRAMSESLDNFRYTPCGDAVAGESSGALLLSAIAADYPDPRGMRFYLAGPEPDLKRLTEGLLALGVDRQVIRSEVTG